MSRAKTKENNKKNSLKGKKGGNVLRRKITTMPQIGSLQDDENRTYHE